MGITAVNEPTAFFAGDGWQDVTSDYVTFRVPGTWQITAVEPGMGSVLAEWHLGIPGVESDQSIAFLPCRLPSFGLTTSWPSTNSSSAASRV